jgi:TPR repeat protein
MGASEELLDRLADGELVSVLRDLKKRAQSGDPSAVNILGEFAYQKCHLGRSEEVIGGYASQQMAEARTLPTDDEPWFDQALNEDVAHDKAVAAVCKKEIDVDEVLAKVAAQAAGGDGASLWIMANTADNMIDMNQRMRDAAAAGFPEAQFELAWSLIAARSRAGSADSDTTNVGELLRQASDSLSVAEGELAECEDAGCEGVTPNLASAISHAREAAERGSIDALISIGTHVPISVIDPDEVSAWALVQAGLRQQGCVGSGFDVRSMKSITSTLDAPAIRPTARSLADRYWKEYGAQIRSNLGCTP